jgi:hypothetical protein
MDCGAKLRDIQKAILTIPILGDKKIQRALETFSGLPNFFGVAMRRSGCHLDPAT